MGFAPAPCPAWTTHSHDARSSDLSCCAMPPASTIPLSAPPETLREGKAGNGARLQMETVPPSPGNEGAEGMLLGGKGQDKRDVPSGKAVTLRWGWARI